MAKAAIQRTVKFISKSGTYTAYLSSQYGRIWQMYDEVWNCVPDWSQDNVIVYFTVVSSLVANGQAATINVPTWTIGGSQINNGSTILPAWTGVFELVPIGSGNSYHGLKIKQNLAQRFTGSSTSLKAVAEMSVGNDTTTTIQAEVPVTFTPATEGGVSVIINDVSTPQTKNFTFTVDNENIILKAQTYQGLAQLDDTAQHIIDNGISYQWQKLVGAVWTNISGATSQTLTVNERDIMTYGQYRCAVTYSSGVFYGSAPLMDATDPYIINPYPQLMTTDATPVLIEDGGETIEEPNTQVVYSPKIVLRGSNTQPTGIDQHFDFSFTDSAGSEIKNPVTNATSAAVTYNDCLANGNISVNIESHTELAE